MCDIPVHEMHRAGAVREDCVHETQTVSTHSEAQHSGRLGSGIKIIIKKINIKNAILSVQLPLG